MKFAVRVVSDAYLSSYSGDKLENRKAHSLTDGNLLIFAAEFCSF